MSNSFTLLFKRFVRIMQDVRLLVDGMNVIGSRPDGWWRDRRAAMRRLVEALAGLAGATGDEVTVVLDSRPFDVGDAGPVAVRFAPGGRNSGDDMIVRIVERDPEPDALTVVTSDKELAARVRALGARVTPAGELRAALDRLGDR
jgi:predicted RNA-binding protein with PIN domain